jgi:tetratricopeptide repeat protein 30
MTSQNEIAEELMRTIEKEEERFALEDPARLTYHLCIVNLVIGTLYCAKGNYEFGISRITKSLEPMNKKLSTDTWFYAKRCLVALFEILAKHMLLLKDTTYEEILNFLVAVETHGKGVAATLDVAGPLPQNNDNGEAFAAWGSLGASSGNAQDQHKFTNNAAFEARKLRALYLRLYD